MLSHLVGASNRADIRRLSQHEAEVGALRTTVEEIKSAMRSGFSRRDTEIQALQRTLARALAEPNESPTHSEEITTLRNLVTRLRQQVAAENGRRERYSAELIDARAQINTLLEEIRAAQNRNRQFEDDLHALKPTSRPCRRNRSSVATSTELFFTSEVNKPRFRTFVIWSKGAAKRSCHDGGHEQKIGLLPD